MSSKRTGEPRNQCAGPFGAVYHFYIEREWLMRFIGRLVWGIDVSVVYASFAAIGAAGDGATIIDIPCGGGVVFRALHPEQDVRYLAGDISERMLERARRRAQELNLQQIEVLHADMLALPFEDATAELIVSYSGLHMLEDPQRAVREMARCLKPGGQLVGVTFLREGSRRQQTLFEQGHRQGHALPPARADLERWLNEAGILSATVAPDAGFAAFRGHKR